MTNRHLQIQVVAHVKAGFTYGQTARLLGMTRNAVAGYCHRAGLKVSPEEKSKRVSAGLKTCGKRLGKPPKAQRNAELVAAYRTRLWSVKQLAHQFGISDSRVSQIVKRELARMEKAA